VCNSLLTFALDPESWWPASEDVLLLAHELQHARGVYDEAVAECFGLQSVQSLARELGADAMPARLIGAMAASRYRDEAAEYRSPQCRNGGSLDLRPRTNDWP
jgi:hypothetical protein